MTIVLDGSAGITNDGGYTGDGVVFADTTPANTLVTTTGGNVGIGTSSPAQKLNVSGSGSIYGLITNTGTGSSNLYLGAANAQTQIISRDASTGAVPTVFIQGTTESARIDSSGNLLVGTTSNGFNVRLNVLAQNTSNPAAIGAQVGLNGAYALAVQNASGSNVGGVIANASTTSYATSSDYRLKENIAPMTGALAKVAALNPVTYTWKSTGQTDEGFIAHELAEVCPQAVTGEKDAVDAEGNPRYQGIDTSFLVATLTAAIQEQQAIILAQESALNALTARVAALEGK